MSVGFANNLGKKNHPTNHPKERNPRLKYLVEKIQDKFNCKSNQCNRYDIHLTMSSELEAHFFMSLKID